MLATEALHETVAVPEPVTLFGVMDPQVSPDGTVAVRLTNPAKWFSAATVIVEVAEFPAFTGAGDVAAGDGCPHRCGSRRTSICNGTDAAGGRRRDRRDGTPSG